MKHFFLSLLVFSILLSSVFASAEDTPRQYNWSDYTGIVSSSFADNSKYYLVEDVDAVFWLPDYFSPVDLTEEDIENGGVGSFVSSDGSALVYLSYSDMPELSFNSFYSYFVNMGYDVEYVSVNDIPAILMHDSESNILTLSYQTADGKLFQVLFYPASDENYSVLFDLIISSIRPYSPLVEASAPAESSAPSNPVSGLISK